MREILLETGLAPTRPELEITEGVLIGDFTRAVATRRRLKGLGVRIAMDDFGTGYSSLPYLQSFVAVAEVRLQGASVMAVVRQLIAASVAQHMRVGFEAELGLGCNRRSSEDPDLSVRY